MQTIRQGMKSEDVRLMQTLLAKAGVAVSVDGDCGPKTVEALKRFQSDNGMTADGVCGKGTWSRLFVHMGTPLTDDDYEDAAKSIGVETAALRAVVEVETGGRGFISYAYKPTILFEGHIFYRRLKERGVDADKLLASHPNVVYKAWSKTKYKGGVKEYDRLEEAKAINLQAALESASWGLPQIMGFNYNACGYGSVVEMVNDSYTGERAQLMMMARFLKRNGWAGYLADKDWAGFASKYNGPSYAKNNYDGKLKKSYEKWAK